MIKRVYIYRNVDLEFVAFGDTVFSTRREAEQEFRQWRKEVSLADIIIQVDLLENDYTFDEIKEQLESENVFEKTLDFVFDCKIIYRR